VVPSEFFSKHYVKGSSVDTEHTVNQVHETVFGTTEGHYLYNECFKLKEQPATTTAAATVTEEEEPKIWVVEVQFPSDYQTKRWYEYYAFGTFDELSNATHAVTTKNDWQDVSDLIEDSSLTVVRIMNVKPVSQQKFNGKLRYI